MNNSDIDYQQVNLPKKIHSFAQDCQKDIHDHDYKSQDQNQIVDFEEILDRLNSQNSQRNIVEEQRMRPFDSKFQKQYFNNYTNPELLQNNYSDNLNPQIMPLEPAFIIQQKHQQQRINPSQSQMLQLSDIKLTQSLTKNDQLSNQFASQNQLDTNHRIKNELFNDQQMQNNKQIDKNNNNSSHTYKSKSVEQKTQNSNSIIKSKAKLKQKHSNPKNKQKAAKVEYSAYEEFEKIKFQCYDLSQQILEQNKMFQNQFETETQSIKIPINIWNQMKSASQAVCKDYQLMQEQMLGTFEQQIQIQQKLTKKNRHYQKLLRDYENQSLLIQRDQRHYEESIKDITKEHNVNKNKMAEALNQIESQVSQLKNTRDILSKQRKQKYEQQLDHAVQQMMQYFNCVEQDQEGDEAFYDSIFIRPTLGKIKFPTNSQVYKQVETPYSLNEQNKQIHFDNESPQIPNSGAQRQKTPNIPKLPIERISIVPGQEMKASQEASSTNRIANSDQKNTENQKGNFKQRATLRTNRGSSRQYSQASQRSQKAQVILQGNQVAINQKQQNDTKLKNEIKNHNNGPQSIPEVDEKEETVIITNPVMVGVMNKTSKFEHIYEDDYYGANVTLDMQTERLKQFPEEYEMLMNVQDPDQRILLKQQVFFIYEKLLRKQAKQEKKRKKKEKQRILQQQQEQLANNQQQQLGSLDNAKDISSVNKENENVTQAQSKTNHPHKGEKDFSSASSANQNPAVNKLGMNERHVEANDVSQIVTSRFSLQSELPSIDTQEIMSAQKKYRPLDVNQSEIIDLEISVNGLKTATQKSLIKKIDEEFRQKEIQKKQFKDNEAKMNYSSSVVSKINSGSNYDNYDPSNRDGNYNSNNYFSNNNEGSKQRNEKLIWIAESDSNRSASDMHNQISQSLIEGDNHINSPLQGQFDQPNVQQDYFPSSSDRSSLPFIQDHSIVNPQIPSSHKSSKLASNHSKTNSVSSQIDRKDLIKEVRKSNLKTDQNTQQDDQCQINDENLAEQYKNIQYIQKYNSKDIESQNKIHKHNEKLYKKKGYEQNQQCLSQRNYIYDSTEKQQKSALEVIQERLSEFSLSLITNAARLNSHRSRQSKTNMNQYENNGSVVYKKGNSVNFSSIDINSNNQQINILNKQESLSYIHESGQKLKIEAINEGLKKDNEVGQKKINFRSISQQSITQNENDFYLNPSEPIENQIKKSQLHQKEIIKVENQKQRKNKQKQLDSIQDSTKKDNLNQEDNQNKKSVINIASFNKPLTQLNTERSNPQNLQKNQQNIHQQSLSHRTYLIGPDKNKIEINDSQELRKQGLGFQKILNLRKHESQQKNPQQQIDGNLKIVSQNSLIKLEGLQDNQQNNKIQKFDQQIEKDFNQIKNLPNKPLKQEYFVKVNNETINDMPIASYNGNDIFIGQVDLNGSLENMNHQDQKLIGNLDVFNTQESIGRQILRVADQTRPHNSMIRSSSECQLRDKDFYDMCDDEDEIVLYCKLAEQSILDAIHLRNLSDFQNVSRIKVNTADNDPFRNSITQNQLDFAQNYSESLKKFNLISRHQSSSQNPNNKMVFMSQKTMNKMYNRYLQTQEKTQLLIGKQFANNIIDHAASVTVDQNSSQQQTRGKATFNRIMLGGGISSIQGGLLKFPQQNLNQNNNGSNYLGTNLLQTSFNDCTLPFCHNIMMPTHQYNRRTLLMMQNLHNNYLYSANSGILFTQRGWNSGLAAQMTSDNGSLAGRLGTKIGQSLINLSNIGNKDNLQNNELTANRISGDIENERVDSDLRTLNIQAETKQIPTQINFDSKIIDYNTLQSKNQDINLLSGEPVNISNFIFGAKQQTQDQKNQSCITIVDDDCKMMLDRKLLNEAKNQSHQMKVRNIFLQSNKTSTRIPQCQQSSSDFSQQQTEHRQAFGLLKGMNTLIKSSQHKKFDFNNNEQLTSKKIEIIGVGSKKLAPGNQILFSQSQIKKQDEVEIEKGNQHKIVLKKKEKLENAKLLDEQILIDKNQTLKEAPVIKEKNQKQDLLLLKGQKSQSQDQNNKLKKLGGNTKILNLITGLKQIQQRQAIKKQADTNNNTLNIIQLLDQQKKQRANKINNLQIQQLGIKVQVSEDKISSRIGEAEGENKQHLQEKLLIASGINRTNNNSVQIQKRKIKSSLSYQTEQVEFRQSKQHQTISEDYY